MSLPASALRIRTAWTAFLLVCLTLWACSARTQPVFPELTGHVVDAANILSPEVELELSRQSIALEKQTSDQFVVVTVNGLEGMTIKEFGQSLGNHWRVGQSGRVLDSYGHRHKDNGILLIVAPNQRQARIEVGYGLESVLSDEKAAEIMSSVMVPLFAEGEYERGVLSGSDAIINVLRDNHSAASDHRETNL